MCEQCGRKMTPEESVWAYGMKFCNQACIERWEKEARLDPSVTDAGERDEVVDAPM